MYNIDFMEPKWLINYYRIIGNISILLNSFGIYLLVFHCKSLDKFRYNLLAFHIMGCLTDFQLTHLMQPVPLYPLLAGYTVGILAEWFDITTHYSMLMVMFISLIMLELLVLCFNKKHQSIAVILNTHITPKYLSYPLYAKSLASPFIVCIWFHMTHLTKAEQWEYIRKNVPQYEEGFKTIKQFDIYPETLSILLLTLMIIIGGVSLFALFLILIIDIFRMMYQLKPRISKANFEKHVEAIKSLVVQLITTSFIFGLPCILAIVIILGIDQAQLITELCIAWIAAYSSVNTVSLMIFFPPFRNFILKTLRIKQPQRRRIAGGGVSSILLWN